MVPALYRKFVLFCILLLLQRVACSAIGNPLKIKVKTNTHNASNRPDGNLLLTGGRRRRAYRNHNVDTSVKHSKMLGKGIDRIIGGYKAPRSTTRSIVVLDIKTRHGMMMGACTGSVLSAKHVLTAAHCFMDDFDSLNFVHKVFVRQVNALGKPSRKHEVLYVDVLRSFSERTLRNDVAIVTLKTTMKYITKVQLPSKTDSFPVGTIAYAAGFGLTSNGGAETDHVREVDLRHTSINTCKRRFDWRTRRSLFPDEVICMRDPEAPRSSRKGICSGDSGGPMFMKGKGGVVLQKGIASFTEEKCVSRGSTAWFVNLKSYVTEINELVEEDEYGSWDLIYD